MENRKKIHFQLETDEDGWPPVGVESVWARPGNRENEYIIDNIPFFACAATAEDTVQIREENGNLWFEKLLQESSNSLIRIIVTDPNMIMDVSKGLVSMGCGAEVADQYKLIAVNVPASVKLSAVLEYLQLQARANILDYEEAILRQ